LVNQGRRRGASASGHHAAPRLATVGGALVVVSVSALGVYLLAMPADWESRWGASPLAAMHFADVLGIGDASASDGSGYGRPMLGLLLASWIGYALMLAGIARDPSGIGRWPPRLAAAWVMVLALAFPPALSQDVYAYAGYARMALVHGLDPHTTSTEALRVLGDPIAGFLDWNLPSPYGVAWTAVSCAIVAPFLGSSLYAQVVGFKLAAAAALCGVGWAMGRLANRRCPGTVHGMALAVILNPLLLIEGPGTGHNDLIVMLPVAVAAIGLLHGRRWGPSLLLGLGGGMKFIPLLALPFIWVGPWRTVRWPNRLGPTLLASAGVLPMAFYAGDRSLPSGLAQHIVQQSQASMGSVIGESLPFAFAYVAVLALVGWWSPRAPDQPAWEWGFVAAVLLFFLLAVPILFPWYLTWALALSFGCAGGRGFTIAAGISALGAGLGLLHAVPLP
jgi:hypothetical protein